MPCATDDTGRIYLPQGELGDDTSVLSKEWQSLTPRHNSATSSGTTFPNACLDSLLDGIAKLSTTAADGGGSDGSSLSGSVRSGRAAFGGAARVPGDSPTASSQHTGSLQARFHKACKPCLLLLLVLFK